MATADTETRPLETVGEGTTDTARYRRIFWLFACAHLVVWTVVPVLTQPNAPLDTVELVFWGHEWQLGYPKHPPLPSWISEALRVLAGSSVWAIYLASQVAVVLCFWAAWRLGRELISPRAALAAACLLECCYYYNFETTVFNNNTGMYPCWALAVLLLYWALQSGRNRYWVGCGVALGLGLLSKYSTIMLAVPMLAFMLLHPRGRRAWSRPGPYLTLLWALLIFGPHLGWSVANGFPTLRYAAERTQSEGQLIGHLLHPLHFAAAQLLALLPLLIVASAITGFRWRLRKIEPHERFGRDFLLAMTLGPFVLHLAVSALAGVSLRSMYGSQLWIFAGVLMLFCLQIDRDRAKWRSMWAGCATMGVAFVAVTVVHDVGGPYLRGKTSRVHFPGKALAAKVEGLWHGRYERPLPAVTGDWWLGGNVALYGPSRATVYEGSRHPDDLVVSPDYCGWMDDEEFLRCGGAILWDARRYTDGPGEAILTRFPTAELCPTLEVPYRTGAEIPPALIGVALVPPASQRPASAIRASLSDVSNRRHGPPPEVCQIVPTRERGSKTQK